MHISKSHAKFSPGAVAATPGVLASVSSHEIDAALQRHFIGDWGDLTQGDRLINEGALRDGGRLLSSDRSQDGVKFWIITEADRSSTTVLLPEEY